MELALAPLRTMEPAIVERLRLAFPVKGFGIERVPSVLTQKEFERVLRVTPFIGLSWTGLRPDKKNGRELQAAWRWAATIVYRATGSLDRRFKGDAQGLGLDPMVDVTLALLQGHSFPRIGLCTVTGAEAAYAEGFSDDDIVVARIDFEITTTTSPASFSLKTAEDFSRLGISWLTGEPADPPVQPTIPDTIAPGGTP